MSSRPVALVTGAARRVGAAIAVELARSGFDLVLTSRSGAPETDETDARARAAAGGDVEIRWERADLADPSQTAALADRLAALPRLDALVHNAGSYGPTPLGTIDDAVVMEHYRVNAVAPLLLTQAAAPLLRRSSLPAGAAVVCIGDIHAMGRPRRRYAAYGMAKAALSHLVECLARELAPQVRVNAIAPGVVAWADDMTEAERAAYLQRIPLQRAGTPEDVAGMVRWLVLEAQYVTGEVMRLDGGRWLV